MNDMEYRYFYELARTLNFNQAAENLFITQPALSKCIFKLEEQFGVRLFIRTKRSVRLTDAGVALLNHYPIVQKAEHELLEKVRNASRGLNQRLVIGIQEGHLITPYLRSLIDGFKGKYPDIRIDIINNSYIRLFEQLSSREIDVAFALEFPGNIYPNICHKVVERKESFALVGKGHPAANAGSADEGLKMLEGKDLLLVKWSIVPNATSYILNQCHANGIVPANVHYASSYLTLYNWLIMEKGFAIMDKGTIFSEELIAHLPLIEERFIHMCLYWAEDVTSTAVIQFLETIEKGCVL